MASNNDLTTFAAEGFDSAILAACPYIDTSDASNAWHFGRHMRRLAMARPTPRARMNDPDRVVVTAGRGNLLNIRGYKDTLINRFACLNNNQFNEARF